MDYFLNNTVIIYFTCLCYLSSEVSVHCNHIVQLCEDLPEDLIINFATLPRVKIRSSTRVKGHITDNQAKTTRR